MKFCHCRHLNMQMSWTVGYVLSRIAITNTWVFIIGKCANFLNFSKLTIVTCPWLLWCCKRQCSWFCSMTFLRERKKKRTNWIGVGAEGILSFQMWDIIQPLPHFCHFHNPFSYNPSGECKSQTAQVRCSKLLEARLAGRQQCEGGCRSKHAEWKDGKKNHKHLRSEDQGRLP